MTEVIIEGKRIIQKAGADKLELKPGEYGFDIGLGLWVVKPPGCEHRRRIKQAVTEHEDRTITIEKSIVITEFDDDGKQKRWHGYLEKGVWREITHA